MANQANINKYGAIVATEETGSIASTEDTSSHDDVLKEVDASSFEGTSTVLDAALNFISSLVGAGIIGYGSAIAKAGGLVSLVAILFFATMNKYAFDLVIALSIETEGTRQRGSFENLGYAAFGKMGRLAVVISKGLFIFGCLVVYIVIWKDNFSPAAYHLMYGTSVVVHDYHDNTTITTGWLASLIQDSRLTTAIGSTLMVLPLILMRDVTPLAKICVVKLAIFGFILCLVVHLYLVHSGEEAQQQKVAYWISDHVEESSFQEHWLSIHSGVIGSLGTFLFGFTAQHTVNIVFQSLKPELKSLENWKKVSTWSTTVAVTVSVLIGFVVYMTFWEHSDSNMFMLYTPTIAVDVARLLLGLSSLLTYPLPFFSLRELLVLAVSAVDDEVDDEAVKTPNDDVESQSLLIAKPDATHITDHQHHCWWLIPGEESQLIPAVHWMVTGSIYLASLTLALYARSLGDVLNLVGCATGTTIAFILPAVFSFRLKGYSHFSLFILLVGGSVGLLGTRISLQAMLYGSG